METTITENKPKNKYEIAEAKLAVYKELKEQKSRIDREMKEHKADLESFAEENRSLFVEGQLKMRNGTLRYADRNAVKLLKKFNIRKAVEMAAEYLKVSVPVAAVKQAYQTDEGKKKMKDLGIQLQINKEFTVEV